MRSLFGAIASGHVEVVTDLAFDAFSHATGETGAVVTEPRTWTHTPVGIPKGVVVFVVMEGTSADRVVGVTYGGVTMSHVSGSPFDADLGAEEDSFLDAFFLGSSIPTGAQTVSVDLTSTGGGSVNAGAFTVVAPGNTEIEDTSVVDNAAADPTVAVTIATDSFVCGCLYSGEDTTSNMAVASGYTEAWEHDTGGQMISMAYKTATTSANTSMSWVDANTRVYTIFAVAVTNV